MKPVIQDVALPHGIHLPAETLRGFLWGGVEHGVAWFETLPSLVEDVCRQHDITQLRPSPEMRMNLVLFGESAVHGPVVLKLAPPHPEVSNEIAAMQVFSRTRLYTRLIDVDESAAWLLQRRIQPGDMLQTYARSGEIAEDDATRIAATLMQETIQPLPADVTHQFPDLNRWLESLWEHARNPSGIIPEEQLRLALELARALIENPHPPMLLHGDFHHGNILKSEHGWMMIDPKGIIAEKAFEVGPFFYNPIGVDVRPNLPALFDRRLDIFSQELGIDRVRLWQCALVACVLSDCWSLQDGPVNHVHYDTVTAALMSLPERYA